MGKKSKRESPKKWLPFFMSKANNRIAMMINGMGTDATVTVKSDPSPATQRSFKTQVPVKYV